MVILIIRKFVEDKAKLDAIESKLEKKIMIDKN